MNNHEKNKPSWTTRSRPLLRCGARVAILVAAVLLHLGLLVGEKNRETAPDDLATPQKFGNWAVNKGNEESPILLANQHEAERNTSSPTLTRGAEINKHQSQVINDADTKSETESYNASTRNKIRQSCIRTDTDGSSWTESHSPRNQSIMNKDVRISFRLHDPSDVPYPSKFLSVHGYICPDLMGNPLPSSISGRTVLNFTTTISTDLNILFVGDSIAQQFAQGFYASVLGEENVRSHVITRSFINGRDIETTNSGLHVCSSLVAPTRGGGVSAYWRVLELMSKRTEALAYVNCKREKGWLGQDGKKLSRKRYTYPSSGGEANPLVKENTTKNNGATTFYQSQINYNESQQQFYQVGGFDCCVLRLQHGWMELHEITRDRIVEEIELCNTVVGATTVIVSTLPLNNNVLTPSDWEGIIAINEIIRDIARSWKPPSPEDGGVQWVLVQEFGNFTNQILWQNAHVSLFVAYTCICLLYATPGSNIFLQ